MADIVEIIEKAKELGKLLKDCEQVKAFHTAKLAYEQNKDMQELIGQFNIHKMSMAALSKQDNPDEERIAKHEEELKRVYDEIMSSDLMTNYQQKSQAVEKLIADINNILNLYAFGENSQGCSGSCSTCSGCSGK